MGFDINYVKGFVTKNSNCELLSDTYKNVSEKLLFKCSCGNTFETTFAKFKDRNKRQCNQCGRMKRADMDRNNIEDVLDFISKNSDCILLENEYINQDTPMKFKCGCGEEFETTMRYFKFNNKRQCDKCGKMKSDNAKRKYSYDYIKELLESHGCELLLERKYEFINRKIKIPIKCSCGEIFETTIEMMLIYDKFQCNQCGYKNSISSIGEVKINEYLNELGVEFKEQYSIDECKYKYKLRFDFAIFNKGELICLIEYDGQQHFKPFDFFGGEKSFEKTKTRDNIKNEYCKNNNIPLLRIPYTELDNITHIIDNYLKTLNE